MKDDGTATTVESIEELTLLSLGRTGEGLDELVAESQSCAQVLRQGDPDGYRKLGDLATRIDGFSTFHGDVVSLFQIDSTVITDGTGSLNACEDRFRSVQDSMLRHLEVKNTEALVRLLHTDLPDTLSRFKELLPPLTDFIEREYVLAEPGNA